MSHSVPDILMISLQFLYAFGGLVLMGSLIFNIMKNQALVNDKRLRFEQDFDVTLASQLEHLSSQSSLNLKQADKTGAITLDHKDPHIKREKSTMDPGPNTARKGLSSQGRVVPAKKKAVHKNQANRYSLAARLAARGLNARDIRHKVGLPQCEVDLIANLNDTRAMDRWQAHQPMLDAIESGI